MKNKIIKRKPLVAACLAGVVSTSALAFESQDYGTSTLIGHADFNVHSIWRYNNVICGALCVAFSTESGHNFTHLRVPDNLPGASETLTCDITDASGNILSGTQGNTPELIFSYSYNDDFGGVPGNDVTSDSLNGSSFPQFGNSRAMIRCELKTDELGKISGGWMEEFHPVALSPPWLYVFYDFTNNKSFFLHCGSTPPTIAQVRAIDAAAIQAGDLATVPPSCSSVDSVWDMNYLTCDTRQACGLGGKAVPIPAFTALLLCLGVVLIARSTAARRHEQ